MGPTAVGWLKQSTGSFVAPMLALSGVLVAGAALTLVLRRSQLLRD